MRKWISLLLIIVLLLAFSACNAAPIPNSTPAESTTPTESTGSQESSFQVGYGKADITPKTSVPLRGYGKTSQRMSKNILSPLLTTCCAITDADGNTILIYGIDLCSSNTASTMRGQISSVTGVPVENICISASHTHSAPDTESHNLPGIPGYLELLEQGLIQAATDALADRKPAEMFGAAVETKGLNFVRRYVLNDGTYGGDNYGDFSSGIRCHETDVDNTMQLIKFTREGDNDIIIANFQTHPHRTGGSKKYDVSADIVGEFRRKLERGLDCEVVYFTGGSGNVNPTSRITSENRYSDWIAHGQAMAQAAKKAVYTPMSTGKVQVSSFDFVANINHTQDSYADICKDLYSKWTNNTITTAQLIAEGKNQGIILNSPYHANAIANRAALPESSTFTVSTFSFGDAGFVVAPYEMFDSTGMEIKAASPFEMTIIATCANGGNGYFPTLLAFDHGGYSVDTTKYVRGTAESLRDQFISMLEELHVSK